VPRAEIGRRGEAAVAAWYASRGFSVVARNWRCSGGELDLVLTDAGHDTIVFCEVKTRTSARLGSPLESVTGAKRRRLRALAGRWLAQARPQGFAPGTIRLDVAAVRPGPGGAPVVEVVEVV
jgi:putative endonuclease